MLAGHYAVSLALKGIDKRLSLGVLFLAVQFVDLLTNLLVAVGIEKIKFVPHHLATGAVKLVHMPYLY